MMGVAVGLGVAVGVMLAVGLGVGVAVWAATSAGHASVRTATAANRRHITMPFLSSWLSYTLSIIRQLTENRRTVYQLGQLGLR